MIGPNGAGKSTLLKAVYRLVPTVTGSIRFGVAGELRSTTGMESHELTQLGMNFVPQLANVFANLTVLENLEVSALGKRRQRNARIDYVLQTLPILAARRRQRAGTLSGGQRKMLALGRALVTDPQLLLLDEPSAGLSPTAAEELFGKLGELHDSGVGILLVEQNASRSLAMAQYAFVLDMGRNRFDGRGPDLLHDPNVRRLYLGEIELSTESMNHDGSRGG